MLSLLENEFVNKKHWIEADEFSDMIAVAESTPGPLAVNSATYIGYRIAKIPGAVLATVAVCIPSFLIIYLISLFFDRFLSLPYVGFAFRGIQVCVIYLIISTGIKLIAQLKRSVFNYVILSLTIVAMVCFSLFNVSFSAVFYILISGGAGLLFYTISYIGNKKDERKK